MPTALDRGVGGGGVGIRRDFRLMMTLFQVVAILGLILQSFPGRVDGAPMLNNEVPENTNAVKTSDDQKSDKDSDDKADNLADIDLSDFSDKELVQLAKLLQEKIDAYDSQVPVEEYDMVLFPVELLEESQPKNDHMLRTLVRDRRTPKVEDDQVPIIVISEEEVRDTQENEYLIVPEPGDPPLVPGAPNQAVILSEDELDELELRTRIAELSEILRERAVRGL